MLILVRFCTLILLDCFRCICFLTPQILGVRRTTYFLRSSWQGHHDFAISCTHFQHRTNSGIQPTTEAARILFTLHLNSYSICTRACENKGQDAKLPSSTRRCLHFLGRTGLGSKLYLSNALSMLNKNLTRFMQSLVSVQSICTVRKALLARWS